MKKNKSIDSMMRNITSFGDGFVALVIVAMVTRDVNVVISVILGLLLIYVLGYLIKVYIFRERPEKQFFHESFAKPETSSFPSFHVARSSFAYSFTLEFLQVPYIFIPLVIVVLVAISRIYLKKHYIIDTVFGVIFGVAIYYLFKVLY